jgi:RNA polymerase-binding transcription factor DksA
MAKKAAKKKAPAKKAAPKKKAPAKKSAAKKKAPAKKAAVKRAPAKKAPAKKAPAKKAVPKKKAPAKKAPAKKAPAKKAPAKKAPAKKAPAKKAPAKKAPAKKAPAKKAPAKKAPAKKAPAKKAAPKKKAAKKPSAAQKKVANKIPIRKRMTVKKRPVLPHLAQRPLPAATKAAGKPRKLTAAFLKKQKQKLLDLRDTLVDQMNGVARDSLGRGDDSADVSAFGMHQADAGSDSYDRDFALNILSQEQDALNEIEEALIRIDSREYGVCQGSGDMIPPARLEAMPFARCTVEYQEKLDEENTRGSFDSPVSALFGAEEEKVAKPVDK